MGPPGASDHSAPEEIEGVETQKSSMLPDFFKGLGFRVEGLGFRAQDFVQGLGFRASDFFEGLGFRV